MFRSKYWRRLKENARNCILGTHLPSVLLNATKLKELWTTGQFKSFEIEHRQMLRELVVVCATLSFACRPYELYKEILLCAHEEYMEIIQELKSRPNSMSFSLRWVLPEDKKAFKSLQVNEIMTPSCLDFCPVRPFLLQATFLRRFCLPLFDLLKTIFPDTTVFFDACVQNLEKLDPESRFDQLSTLSHIDGGVAGHKKKDRHVSSEMRRIMRRNVWEDMRIPFEQRDIEYQRLADIPYIWHKSSEPSLEI